MPYDRDILVAEFLLTSASRGPSAIAELLVEICERTDMQTDPQRDRYAHHTSLLIFAAGAGKFYVCASQLQYLK